MKFHKTSIFAALGILGLLAISASAAAQDPVVVRAWPSFASTPPEVVELPPDTLRADYPMDINLAIDGEFACAQPVQVSVEILVPSFPPWAGMSLVPDSARVATFEIPTGRGPYGPESAAGPVFNIAWDEDAPVNTTQRYEIVVTDITVTSDTPSEPCAGNPGISSAANNAQTSSAFLNVTRPWTPPAQTDGEEVDCTLDPENPECRETGTPTEDGPGFDVVFLTLALVGAVAVLRHRRRN